MIKLLLTEKFSFKVIELVSIAFVGVSGLTNLIPVVVGALVALSLVVLNLAKAFKIFSETRRENKKDGIKEKE